MCGIVGYVGKQKAIPVLLQGLEHLEYRGYDSAGIACLNDKSSHFFVCKERGKIAQLKASLNGTPSHTHVGIGHTRWATHGAPSKTNAHPHLGSKGQIALVHNGIIENHAELKAELKKKGCRFRSETDTEVAAQLIEHYYKGDLAQAIRRAAARIKGFFAFVVMAKNEPDRIFALKRSNPLVIGIGKDENFIASDVSALISHTKKVIYLNDDELVELTRDSVRVSRLKSGVRIKKKPSQVSWNFEEAKKGGYPHFMLKEIHEQPEVLERTLKAYVHAKGFVAFDSLNSKIENRLRRAQKIFLVSCGTAHHAGIVGRYMFEELARVPSEADVSSEFRYADPLVSKEDVVVLISQSGETADTLAAMREAKRKGAFALAIVNVVGSTIEREADAVIHTLAGPEIGVASTKAYLAQLLTLALFTIYLGSLRKKLAPAHVKKLIAEAFKLPKQARCAIENQESIREAAKLIYTKRNFIFLGRGYSFPTALEGALKLKEITYAHAHGYAAGEMKHGPIALIDETQPVVCIVPHSKTQEKMISNIEEINARKGIVIAIATEGDQVVKKLSRHVFWIPKTLEVFSPLLTVIPLQLFAYQIAVLNDRDVDQPRNLAKSVTVE